MPAPIAHISVGYCLFRIIRHRLPARRITQLFFNPTVLLLACLAFSILPDGDSALGILFRDFGKFHNQWSHSLFFGFIPALGITLFALLIRPRAALAWGALCLVSCLLHVLLDYCCYGRGVLLFWPFTNERFISPILVFNGVHWSDGFFTMKHVETILSELLFALIIIPPTLYLTRETAEQEQNSLDAAEKRIH